MATTFQIPLTLKYSRIGLMSKLNQKIGAPNAKNTLELKLKIK